MNRAQHELPFPEVDHAGLACQVRRHEAIHQRSERIQFARLGDERLKIALGRKNAVELG